MDLPIDFRELLEEFAREGVELLIVGGYAVAFHARPRATTLRIDLLRMIDGVDVESVFARAVTGQWNDVAIQVISLDDLIANKRAAARPQDLADVSVLERVRASRRKTPEDR